MKEKNNLSRITALTLAVSMVLGSVAAIITHANDSPVPSFSYIESIKEQKNSQSSAFRILEVAPSKTQGSIGYYADQYEPTRGWLDNISEMDTRYARTTYATNLAQALESKGLLGSGGTTPLEAGGDYEEWYPWSDDVPSSAQPMTLKSTETAYNVTGKFVQTEGGDYSVETAFSMPSLFEPKEWYANLMEKVENGLSNNGFSYPGAELALEEEKIIVKTNTTSGAPDYDMYTSYGNSSYYKIPVEPGKKYTINYTAEIEGSGGGQIFILGFGENFTEKVPENSSPNNWCVVWSERPIYNTGTYSRQFIPGANVKWIEIRFGTAGAANVTAKFSDVIIYKNADRYARADAVQDPKVFLYGDAATNKNLFSLYEYYENFAANQSAEYIANGTYTNAEYDYMLNKLILKNQFSFPVAYTPQEAQNKKCYLVDVEPGTEYTFSYDVNVNSTGDDKRFRVTLIGFNDYSSETIYDANPGTESGTFSRNFTPGAGFTKVMVYFEVGSPDTVAEFSNVSILKTDVTPDTSNEYYYYKVNFTKIETGADIPDDTSVYWFVTDENKEDGDTVGTYKYLGEYYANGTGVILNIYNEYFTAEVDRTVGPSVIFGEMDYDDDGQPIEETRRLYRTSRDSEYHFAGEGETPYFVSSAGTGTYVGNGLGFFNLDKNSPGTVNIKTNTIFYQGGYTNNNWFKEYVLSCTENDHFPVEVTTITPDELDGEDYKANLNYYDLIVFSAGLDLGGSTLSFPADVSQDFLDQYGEDGETPFYDTKTPLMFDKNLVSTSVYPNIPKMQTFLNYLKATCDKTSVETGWVTSQIYCYSSSDISTLPANMANSAFNTSVTESLYAEGGAYYEVWYIIDEENDIRESRYNNDDQNMDDTISEAASIRHIINYKGRRMVFNKDTLNILDIEPYTSGKVFNNKILTSIADIGYTYTYKKPDGTNMVQEITTDQDIERREILTEEKFLSWFDPAQLDNGKLYYKDAEGNHKYLTINIRTMAVNELIADNDDILETYDLVYVGDSTYNMYTATHSSGRVSAANISGLQPDYNDAKMDGMYYSSTGDILYTNARDIWAEGNLGGIVSDDYNWGIDVPLIGTIFREYAFLKGWHKFDNRSSGNDLTAKKEKQLENFLEAGMPVVVADNLTSGFSTTLTARCDVNTQFTYRKELTNTYLWGLIKIYKRIPRYRIVIHAWLDGLPSEFTMQDNANVDWRFTTNANGSNSEAVSTKAGEANVSISYDNNYHNSNGDIVRSKVCTILIDMASIQNWTGYIYAQITPRDTGYSNIDNRPFNSNLIKTWLAPQDIYVTCELITAGEYTVNGEQEIREVWPSNVSADYKDTYGFYIPKNQSVDTAEFYTVKYFTEQNNPESRILLDVDNTWYYCRLRWKWSHFLTGLKHDDIEGDYANTPYIKHGDGKGEIKDGYNTYGCGYTNVSYLNTSFGRSSVEVGTPNTAEHGLHNGTASFTTKVLKVAALDASQQFGWPSGAIHAAANVQPVAVDTSSYMYQFLYKCFNTGHYGTGGNVFAERELKGEDYLLNRQDLFTKIGLSCPRIEVDESSVTVYPEVIENNTLSVEFKINNSTDINVDRSRYRINFYIDIDGDAKYREDELTSATVECSTNGGAFYSLDNYSDLRASTRINDYKYRITKTLTDDYTGILPWKIEIIKLDENNSYTYLDENNKTHINYDNLHDSYTNYAYVKPLAATTINAIEVLPSDWNMKYTKNNKAGSGANAGNQYEGCIFASPIYDTLLGNNRKLVNTSGNNWQVVNSNGDYDMVCMAFGPIGAGSTGIADGSGKDYSAYLNHYIQNKGDMSGFSGGTIPDFLVTVECINVTKLNELYGGTYTVAEVGDANAGYQKRNYNETFLENYNMLILGFADSWGKAGNLHDATNNNLKSTNVGLNMGAAFAIQDFIDSKRAVLLTHDTTTIYNNFPNNVILNWLIKNLGGIADTVLSWFGSGLNLEADERVRNGYWINLLRDSCGLDRYGVTYAIKEKAKALAPAVRKYLCEDCGYFSYRVLTVCPRCQSTNISNNPVYDVTDKTLKYGYFNDEEKGHPNSIYSDFDNNGNHTHLSGSVPEDYDTSIETMLKKDYTIAYVPGNGRVNTEEGTEKYVGGYTRYTLTRYEEDGNSVRMPLVSMWRSNNEIYETTYVTQTNKGKITMYPYDINVYEKDSSGNLIQDEDGGYKFDKNGTMEIKATHDQTYQLNMNGDDITCWYCMSGDNFADIPNDAVNSYFIYSRGNITYTGSGHTNTFTLEEAKLFANTLVAAYRPSGEAASINFVDTSKKEENDEFASQDYIILTSDVYDRPTPTDDDPTAVTSVKEMTGAQAHVKLDNKNLANLHSTSNNVSCVLKYSYVIQNPDGTLDHVTYETGDDGNQKVVPVEETVSADNMPDLYLGEDADGEDAKPMEWNAMTENGVYSFEIPAEVLEVLKDDRVTEVTMTVYATTYTQGTTYDPVDDSITIRKLGLPDLA